ncbi:MAG: 30S ribosomal protein S16 [Chloroflexi bacterium]|nr:30S ribosomal protein S16 [Chloroflexota bacterium]
MVKIRLRRVGARKQPYFRVVVADSRSPAKGRFIENLGHLDPRSDPPAFTINEARTIYWLGKGAQPSPAVSNLLVKQGTWDRWQKVKAGEPLEKVLAGADIVKEPSSGEPGGSSLGELGLSTRVLNYLAAAGVETVSVLVDMLKEGRLETVPGLGEKSQQEIKSALREKGYWSRE